MSYVTTHEARVNTHCIFESPRSGFTIVDMWWMLIGLVSIVVMFQSSPCRRASAAPPRAGRCPAERHHLALPHRARRAHGGYGINYYRMLGCSVNGYWNPSASPFAFNLAPVTIVTKPRERRPAHDRTRTRTVRVSPYPRVMESGRSAAPFTM